MLKIVNKHQTFLRIDDPVLSHSGIHILVQLDDGIFLPAGWGKDFQNKVRRTVHTAVDDFFAVAYNHYVRLKNGAVVAVQLYVDRRDDRKTASLFFHNMIHKLCEKETGEQLVNGSRGGHIVDHAVDQFHTDVVRNGIIIFQSIVSLFFDEIGGGSLPDHVGRLLRFVKRKLKYFLQCPQRIVAR